MDDSKLRDYLQKGLHLPPELRDFHDLKDLFKTIGNRDVGVHKGDKNEINWRDGMIYVVDHFLWFMAVHGYEVKNVGNRRDLQKAIQARKDAEAHAFRQHLEVERSEDA